MSGTKIKRLKELKKIIARLQKHGEKIIFTNGCFDIVHFGHIMYLEEAKECGDCLIVAVNSDSSVRKIKGPKRPIVSESDRSRVIAGLACVDYVVIFKENTPLKLIKELKPDILIKGADWKKKNIIGADFVQSYGGKVRTIKLAKGRSTTKLIKKIIERL